MDNKRDVWHHDLYKLVENLLSNPDFDREFNYTPYKEFDPNGDCVFQDFFSGNWAWEQAVSLHTSNLIMEILLNSTVG
jgi:Plavaka transposase